MEKLENFYVKYRSFFRICFICFFFYSIYFYVAKKIEYVQVEKENIELKKELINKDVLLKIGDGKYRKIVDYYSTKSELNKSVKNNSPEIYNTIKNNNETILSNTDASITFNSKVDTISATKKDSLYNFTSYYPNRDSSFIQYDGSLNLNTVKLIEKWSFKDIKLNLILTQKPDGLWNTYLDAPTFVKVNNLTINSLPPADYVPKVDKIKFLTLYGGFGVRSGLTTIKGFSDKDLTINGALSIKNKLLIQGDFSTNAKVGVGFLIKL